MKRILLVLALLIASAPSASAQIASCSAIAIKAGVVKGTTLPCIDGGKSVVMESIKGPAVINVWGSWCAPCIAEMPHFKALAATKKVSIIGIDVEEPNMAAGKKFMNAHGMSWPVLFDPDGRTKAAFGLGVPVTWFLNAKGVVVYKQIGIISSDKALFDEVKKYLGIKL